MTRIKMPSGKRENKNKTYAGSQERQNQAMELRPNSSVALRTSVTFAFVSVSVSLCVKQRARTRSRFPKPVKPGKSSDSLDSPIFTSGLKFFTLSLPHMSSHVWDNSAYIPDHCHKLSKNDISRSALSAPCFSLPRFVSVTKEYMV